MAESRPDHSPTPEERDVATTTPEEGAPQRPAGERIDPLSVAASGLVDVSDVPEERPRLLGRLGRRREHEVPRTEAPRRPGEQTESLDPLAVLARALDAEARPSAPPAAGPETQLDQVAQDTHPLPSPVATSTGDLDLPPELVQLAAAAEDPVPLEPRRRGTFRRRGAVDDARSDVAPDQALFDVAPAVPDEQPGQPTTTPGADDDAASSTPDAPDRTREVGTPAWQPLHEPEPYVAQAVAGADPVSEVTPDGDPSGPDAVAEGASPGPAPSQTHTGPATAAVTPATVAFDDVTEEWSDDDLQATQWAAQWSPATTTAPREARAGERQQEEQNVSWDQSGGNDADTGATGQPADIPGTEGTRRTGEPRRRGFRSRRRAAKPVAPADTTPSTPPTVAEQPDADQTAPLAADSDASTPLDLLSGYTATAVPSAAPGVEQVRSEAADTAAPGVSSEPAPGGKHERETEPEHELWDEPDTDSDADDAGASERSHGGWRGRRRGARRSAGSDTLAATATTPETDDAATTSPLDQPVEPVGASTAEQTEATEATEATEQTDIADYPWTAADLAQQGWTRDDLLGAGWNDEQLLAVGWTAEFDAALHTDADSEETRSTEHREAAADEAPPGETDERAATEVPELSGDDEAGAATSPTPADPVEELLTTEEPTSAATAEDEPVTTNPAEAEADQALAETTDDPVEELLTTQEPTSTATDEAEADQALAETTEDPVEELLTTQEPTSTATAEDEPVTTNPAEAEADQALAETTDDPVEELLTTEADTGSPLQPDTDEAVATSADEPVEELLPSAPVEPSDLVVEEAPPAAAAEEPPAAAASRPAPAAPRDFEFFFDDDLDVEPESFDIEAPLAQRAPAAPPAASVAPALDPAVEEPAAELLPEPADDLPSTQHVTEPADTPVTMSDETATDEASDLSPADVEDAPSSPATWRDDDDDADRPTPLPDTPPVTGAEAYRVEPDLRPEDDTTTLAPTDESEQTAIRPEDDATTHAPTDEINEVDDQPDADDPGEGDEGEQDDGGGPGPGDGPDQPDDAPVGPTPPAAGAAHDQPADEPEPMTYAWALAELTAESPHDPAGTAQALATAPTDADTTAGVPADAARTSADDPATHDDAAEGSQEGPEAPDAAPDSASTPEDAGSAPELVATEPVPPVPPPGPREGQSEQRDDDPTASEESGTPSWSPTWEPTGPSAVAEWPSTASPAATEASAFTVADQPFADSGPIPSPDATAAAAARLATTPEGEEVPPFVEYRPSEARRYVLGALFVAASLLAVLAIFYAVQEGGTAPAITAGAVTVLAGALWWGLLSWAPKIVSLSRGILEVSQGAHSERFDLRDPETEVVVGDNPRSRSWTTTVARPDGPKTVITSTQVRPQQFSTIVRHYRQLRDDAATPEATFPDQ